MKLQYCMEKHIRIFGNWDPHQKGECSSRSGHEPDGEPSPPAERVRRDESPAAESSLPAERARRDESPAADPSSPAERARRDESPAADPSSPAEQVRRNECLAAERPLPAERTRERALAIGQRVRVVGLVQRTSFNGQLGTIVDYDSRERRWRVRLDNSDGGLILDRNLELIAEPTPLLAASAGEAAEASPLARGFGHWLRCVSPTGLLAMYEAALEENYDHPAQVVALYALPRGGLDPMFFEDAGIAEEDQQLFTAWFAGWIRGSEGPRKTSKN